MIIGDIHVNQTAWNMGKDSWFTPENVSIDFFYPTKNETSVKGMLKIPWKKAKSMSLEELNKHVKENVRNAVKELEE